MHAELCPMCKGWKKVYGLESFENMIEGESLYSNGVTIYTREAVACPVCNATGICFVPDDEEDYALIMSIEQQKRFTAENDTTYSET